MGGPLDPAFRIFERSTTIAAVVACALLSIVGQVAAEGVDPDPQGYPDEQQPVCSQYSSALKSFRFSSAPSTPTHR
jgi:hypothetical protein